MMRNCQEGRPVAYLDETWANAHDGKDIAWVDRDKVTSRTLGGIKRPPGKGTRLIIPGGMDGQPLSSYLRKTQVITMMK
jgi:hypothetical protein